MAATAHALGSPALDSWLTAVPGLASGEHGRLLEAAEARSGPALCPPRDQVFRALELTPLARVRVVILGQDPYPGPGQAMGLAFSVPRGAPAPPSLRNIFQEIGRDLGRTAGAGPDTDLSRWARQGVLLLNTVLTVEQGRAGSHRGLGWQALTDAVLAAVSGRRERAAFLLWGGEARSRRSLVDESRHLVLEAPHPSPLSCWRGFAGCGHFSRANAWLAAHGQRPVDW